MKSQNMTDNKSRIPGDGDWQSPIVGDAGVEFDRQPIGTEITRDYIAGDVNRLPKVLLSVGCNPKLIRKLIYAYVTYDATWVELILELELRRKDRGTISIIPFELKVSSTYGHDKNNSSFFMPCFSTSTPAIGCVAMLVDPFGDQWAYPFETESDCDEVRVNLVSAHVGSPFTGAYSIGMIIKSMSKFEQQSSIK